MTDPIRVGLSTEMGRKEVDDMVRLDNREGTNFVDAFQDFALIDTKTGIVTVSDGENIVWTGAAKDVAGFNSQIARDIYGTCLTNSITPPTLPAATPSAPAAPSNAEPYRRPKETDPMHERPSMRHGG
jgi:hypothetical protein